LALRQSTTEAPLLEPAALPIPEGWSSVVNAIIPREELQKLRTSASKQVPFGEEAWVTKISELR
jgi:hypothetical protein